ncbi:glycosyltransferase [Haloferax mucosum]|uniref:glycosyltransferase n=1 Tax=Haloferax mucosum TaxID=403181 RepID=UPI000324D4D1|nr:glycosyltransferase [Haloferax mucosum]
MSRRVLIPTYYYPPYGTVGIFRISKFIKYLPEYGWEPYVVTVRPEFHEGSESVQQFEAVHNAVERTIRTDIPLNTISKGAKHVFNSEPLKKNLNHALWLPELYRTCVQAIEDLDIDVVLSSGGPFIPLVVLPLLQQKTETPYVVDLRDPWTTEFQNIDRSPNPIRKFLAETAEPRVLKNASSVITVTDTLKRQYSSRYPSISSSINVIYNGYDPEDHVDTGNVTRSDSAFEIIYPGSCYSKKHAEPFFSALSSVSEKRDIKLSHYGRKKDWVENLIQKYDLEEIVEQNGYCSRSDVFSGIESADAGLVISRNSNAVSTKTFDFMGGDTPILGVCEDSGELSSVLSHAEHGYTASKNDTVAIERMLSRIHSENPDSLKMNVNKFNVEKQSKNLSGILDSCRM